MFAISQDLIAPTKGFAPILAALDGLVLIQASLTQVSHTSPNPKVSPHSLTQVSPPKSHTVSTFHACHTSLTHVFAHTHTQVSHCPHISCLPHTPCIAHKKECHALPMIPSLPQFEALSLYLIVQNFFPTIPSLPQLEAPFLYLIVQNVFPIIPSLPQLEALSFI